MGRTFSDKGKIMLTRVNLEFEEGMIFNKKHLAPLLEKRLSEEFDQDYVRFKYFPTYILAFKDGAEEGDVYFKFKTQKHSDFNFWDRLGKQSELKRNDIRSIWIDFLPEKNTMYAEV